jgi:uncharacterized protein (TIGR02996 family)
MLPFDVLLSAIQADPGDAAAWLALADCLEEQGQDPQAELVRLREGLRHADADAAGRPPREARMRQLLAEGVRPVGPRLSVPLSRTQSLEMALVPPGVFWMGSPADEPGHTPREAPQHRVRLTKGFFLGVYPVTQAQWRAVRGNNPSRVKQGTLPVTRVSWTAAEHFCRSLSEKAGRAFRLPTEAEWEYACRAGTTTPFSFGATLSTDQANYQGDMVYPGGRPGVRRGGPTRVDAFPCNAWGLCDLHGNTLDWCGDDHLGYGEAELTDPYYPGRNYPAIRGGCWLDAPALCRSAARNWRRRNTREDYLGFRVLACLG